MNTMTRDWMEFWRKFARMLQSGVPILVALETIGKEATSPPVREVCRAIFEAVKEGQDITGVLERFPAYFPPSMVKVVKVGETTGTLPATLLDLATGIEEGSFRPGHVEAEEEEGERPGQEWSGLCRKCARMIHSGIPLLSTLDLIGAESGNSAVREACRVLVGALRDGLTLSEALGRLPGSVSPAIVAMVKAGEVSGDVDGVLFNVAAGIEDGSLRPGSEAESPAETDAGGQETEAFREADVPIIRLVNLMLWEAVRKKASDIYIDYQPEAVRVRFRIDGVLHAMESPPKVLGPVIAGRIKAMASMNTAEKRLPQDGRIQLMIENQPVDVRVSTVPLQDGESIVMRLLSTRITLPGMEELFPARHLATVRRWLAQPKGLVLVNGPLGCGKTTTLYALLRSFDATQRMLMTVEDPVEYRLEGVCRQQVRPEIGLTFSTALRAAQRQAVDVVMIGELRDVETVEIMSQMALTGHLVLASLCTNGGVQAVQRLLDVGLEPYVVSSTLLGVVTPRVFRLICPNCREEIKPEPWARDLFPKGTAPRQFRGKGCTQCHGTGYCGRAALQEVFEPSGDFMTMLARGVSLDELRAEARRGGLVPLRAEGLARVAEGVTTLEEILRVTPKDE